MLIEDIACWLLRAPTQEPIATAFGVLRRRVALLVRVTANDGVSGWGEIYCNFPPGGAEHRATLVRSVFRELCKGMDADPQQSFSTMTARTRKMAIQCGEPGPFAQVIAGIDQALWDMAARRAGLPLWRYLSLGRQVSGRVRVYASGLGPNHVVAKARQTYDEGYRAFKLKVGFGRERDRQNLAALRAALGTGVMVSVDANQAWDSVEQAAQEIEQLAEFQPAWIEEPLAADTAVEQWQRLSAISPCPLAAGENLMGDAAFLAAIEGGFLRYVQPDVGKWGGITRALAVARAAEARGVEFCPHWLGGGVGLAASMHLRASLGEGGYAEVDANDNPLRQALFPLVVDQGWVALADAPGIGFEPDLERLRAYQVEGAGLEL